MDKALLEKILKSGITVQGDLVMEKHVENEIGNVEAGGIGIQIVHSMADKSTPCKPNAAADPLALLNTPEAEALWQRAQVGGVGRRGTPAHQTPGHQGCQGGICQCDDRDAEYPTPCLCAV